MVRDTVMFNVYRLYVLN